MTDGERFSLYAIETGDVHDYWAFRTAMLQDRPGEMAAMIARLERLAQQGIGSKTENFNALGGGLWESKTSGGLRVTFFRRGSNIFILDLAFVKKRQKTRVADIRRAQERKRWFKESMEDEGTAMIVLVDPARPPRRHLS